ncbi:putative iq and hect domain protein [Neofusicoccum parvum UCRNP2]|uniref:Putative iq and hect domain protein n=1 Tax=Botryosphaeria parva (strain UCR-NP2) TaxID=1287680 RepID=R1GHQ1_BOTPV|nr:putative iq and hect domain protein [Neofusicoccum parvum UCRNP2]
MFQTFTGSSRRPRQVNLSGRVSNPFAQPGVGQGSQSAVQSAQQERAQRQRERDRLNAAKRIQRLENKAADADVPYASEADAFLQLQRLLLFMNLRNAQDHKRLARYCGRANKTPYTGGPWPMAYLRLQQAILESLKRQLNTMLLEDTARVDQLGKRRKNTGSLVLEAPAVLPSLETLSFLNELIPKEAATKSHIYYQVMAMLTEEAFEAGLQQGMPPPYLKLPRTSQKHSKCRNKPYFELLSGL